MGTTVSRRLVFVKMKRKQVPPKPKHFLSASDRDTRIGEGHHSSATLVALNSVIPLRPMSIWMVAGCTEHFQRQYHKAAKAKQRQ